MIRSLMAASACAAVLCSSAAQADVVYNWHQAGSGPLVASSSGRLVVTDAAYLAGSVSYTILNNIGPQAVGGAGATVFDCLPPSSGVACRDPAAPIISFSLGAVSAVTDIPGGVGISPRNFLNTLAAGSFVLTLGDLLSGRIDVGAFGQTDEVHLFGTGASWTARYATDNHGLPGCDTGQGCTFFGAWLLDATTVPGFVPEPGVLPLLALGALGVAASLRRRYRSI